MLKVFEAVARLESFTRAAQALHLTQPAVSMQIKQLEEVVGLPMFDHIGKRIYLTEAGRELYRCAKGVSQLLDETESVIDSLKGGEHGRLDVSVATTANYFSTRLLAAFSRLHPAVTYRLDVTNRETLIKQLDANEKDLAIMGQPPADLDVEVVQFMENPLVVIASPHDPLCNEQDTIPLRRLASHAFVVRETGSGTRGAVERFFQQHRVPFRTGIELTSNEAIKQAVQAGLGLGIVSIHTAGLELETKRLVVLPVESFPILRHWYLVWRRGKRLSPVAASFKDFVLKEAATMAWSA